MATTPTPSQMAAHDAVAQTAELQHNLGHLDWELPPTPTPSVSLLEKPPHD